MNEVHPRHREYSVVTFRDDQDLEYNLNLYAPAPGCWGIEKIHFNWFRRGGRVVLSRRRKDAE